MDHINFIYLWDHLAILLRFYLTDAVFLLVMTGIWRQIAPLMKRAGHIKALYRLLLLTEAAAFLFLGWGILKMLIPGDLIGITEIYRGQYFLWGIVYLMISFVLIVVWTIRFRTAFRRFQSERTRDRSLMQFCYPTGSEAKLESFRNLGQRLGLHRLPDLFENPGYVYPVILGVRHPVIIVPFDVFTREEQLLAMSHELVHYKKHDIFWRQGDCFLKCCFWFLPWGEERHQEMVLLQEVLCDTYVCEKFSKEEFAEDYYIKIMKMTSRKSRILPRNPYPMSKSPKSVYGHGVKPGSTDAGTYAEINRKKGDNTAGLLETPAQLTERVANSVNIRHGKKRFALVSLLSFVFLGGLVGVSYVGSMPPDLLSWHTPEIVRPVRAADGEKEVSSDSVTVFKGEESESLRGSGQTGTDGEDAGDCEILSEGYQMIALNPEEKISTEWIYCADAEDIYLDIDGHTEDIQVELVNENGDTIKPQEVSGDTWHFRSEKEEQYKLTFENMLSSECSTGIIIYKG